MALKTQGFALSALPRSPTIPANVGAIDVKEIYDGVRQGLADVEAMRSATQGMALADATMRAKTEQAPLGTAILAEQAAQAPMHTAILASDASPEMLEAKRKALIARTVKPLTGTPYLLRRMDELRAAQLATPDDPTIANAIIETQQLLNKSSAVQPNDPTAALTTKENIGAAANESKEAIAAAGNTTKENVARTNAATPKSGPAALVKLMIDQGYDDDFINQVINKSAATAAANPDADRASREKIATEANKSRLLATQATREANLAKLNTKQQQGLSRALGALESFESDTDHVDSLIDKAISMTDLTSAGPGSLVNGIPLTKARALRGVLDSIRANIGFAALSEMRQHSPTGGALGQVSDAENKLLQSTIEALDQGVDPETLKQRLESVRERRKIAVDNLKNQYDRDVALLSSTSLASPSGTTAPDAPQGTPKFKIIEVK